MPYTFRDRATTKRFDADAADDADFSDPESPVPVKKGRGRPRKHAAPLASLVSLNAGAASDSDDDGSLDEVRQIGRGRVQPPSLDASRMWPPEEDEALKAAIAQYDHQWQKITRFMCQRGFKRTAAMCRNRNARMNVTRKPGKEGKNRCKRCGQVKRGHTCGAPPAEEEMQRRVCRKVVVGDGSSARAIARAGEAAAAAFDAGAATSFGDSLPVHSLLPSGTGFQVDLDGLVAHLHDQNSQGAPPPPPHDTTPVMTPRTDEAQPAPHAVGFLGSAAPPSVAPAATRERSLYDSTSSSFFNASIDLAELHHLSAQALNSKSFDMLLGGGSAAPTHHQNAHPGAPPPPSAAASPTPDAASRHHGDALVARRTECNETPTAVGSVAGGDDREYEHEAALDLVAELEETPSSSHDASPPALGVAMRAAHHLPIPRSLPPTVASTPSLALDKLLPAVAPMGVQKSFGVALDGALSMRPPLERFLQPSYLPNPASRVASPILTELTTMGDAAPPALMAIPSISHAPSFTFADMLPSSQQSFSFTDLESSQGSHSAALFSTPTPMCI